MSPTWESDVVFHQKDSPALLEPCREPHVLPLGEELRAGLGLGLLLLHRLPPPPQRLEHLAHSPVPQVLSSAQQ